jgi:RNA polymerase sigma-70 factor (ECF subfamily)
VRTWLAGCATCVPYLRDWIVGAPGDWHMLPTKANGQPAAAAYIRNNDGSYQAYGIVVLTATPTAISGIVSFGDPHLLTVFGFPATLGPTAEVEHA